MDENSATDGIAVLTKPITRAEAGALGNRSMHVEDAKIRAHMRSIIERLIV